MDKKQVTGLLGALLLLAGVFAPAVALGAPLSIRALPFPLQFDVSYFRYTATVGMSEWLILVGLAGFGVMAALCRMYMALLFCSIVALGTVAFTVVELTLTLQQLLAFAPATIAVPLQSWMEILSWLLVQVEWGAILLVGGPLLMLIAVAMPAERRPHYGRALRRVAEQLVVCRECGVISNVGTRFCSSCGASLTMLRIHDAEPAASPPALLSKPIQEATPRGD